MFKKRIKKTISVIGLGKLGSCLAVFYADAGFNVIGYDIDNKKTNSIKKHIPPVDEPKLKELLIKNKKRITATNSIEEAIKSSQITFVIVPTPSNKDGSFSVKYVLEAMKNIGQALKDKNKFHTVVLVSTVLPEDSRKEIIPTLEKSSGKIIGEDIGYCYSPSLIALGDILNNLKNPDFLFLGFADPKSKKDLVEIYSSVYDKEKIKSMSIESVEIAKISLNSYITTKITFANILSMLCNAVENADVDEITNAIGSDKRVGHYYLRGGLGYGGPCFPRDNFAFAYTANKKGVPPEIALSTHAINESIPKYMTKIIMQTIKKSNVTSTVGILGLAYKPNTHITERSQALDIIRLLLKKGVKVHVFEPKGYDDIPSDIKNSVVLHTNMNDITTSTKTLFIALNDNMFKKLVPLLSKTKGKINIIDPWGIFGKKDFKKNINYVTPGRK